MRQFIVTPTLGRELYQNLTKNRFTLSNESIEILKEIDSNISGSIPVNFKQLDQIDRMINETVPVNGTENIHRISELFRSFLSLI